MYTSVLSSLLLPFSFSLLAIVHFSFSLLQLLLGWLPVPCLSDDDPSPPDIIHEPNRCLWFGQCGDSIYSGKYTCLYNDKPKNITEQGQDFLNLLNETCPQLVQQNRGVCCNMGQLNALATQIKYPQQLFSRCPACLKNFIDHFCLTTCDPDQAAWMNVSAGGLQYNDKDKTWAITSVDIYVSDEYADNLYDSCENVQYPQASTRVIDIMCGTTECSPDKWLTYLGDPTANHESPFMMKYYLTSNDSLHGGLIAKTYDYMECNTTDINFQCSCSDCNAPNVCPPPPQPPPNTFPYFEITIIVVCVGASLSVFIFFVALIAAIVSLTRKSGYTKIDGSSNSVRRSRDHYGTIEDDDDSPTSSVSSINNADIQDDQTEGVKLPPPPPHRSMATCWFQLGSWIEYAIKNVFYHWGKFVAQYWYLVFFFVGIIALALSFGLFFFKITTNPVDLWSSPTSRAREEKAYFDKNFNPFYRTEMIIVTAPKYNYSTYVPYGVVTDGWKFGPVFDPEVLDEVQLQLV